MFVVVVVGGKWCECLEYEEGVGWEEFGDVVYDVGVFGFFFGDGFEVFLKFFFVFGLFWIFFLFLGSFFWNEVYFGVGVFGGVFECGVGGVDVFFECGVCSVDVFVGFGDGVCDVFVGFGEDVGDVFVDWWLVWIGILVFFRIGVFVWIFYDGCNVSIKIKL